MEQHIDTQKAAPPRPPSLWRNRDYMLLWSGQTISSIGGQVSQLAFPLLILALTHSPAQAGIAGALRSLPYFIFTLPGGALIDQWNRKRVMILCDIGRALCLASIPIALALGSLTILQLYLVSCIEGTLFVFFDLAETASISNVVTREQLPAAVAQNQLTFGITYLVGPSIGGLLYSLGRLLPFLTDAVSYAVSVVSLLFVRVPFQRERTTERRRLLAEVKEGLRWLWHRPIVRTMALINCGIAGVGAGGVLLIIVLAQRLHASNVTIGLLLACGGVGSMLGSLIAPLLQRRLSYGQSIIGLLWLYGVFYVLFLLAPNPLALGIVLGGYAVVDGTYNVVQFSYRLALIPDHLQGRVNSAFRLISYSCRPLGLALTGILIQRYTAITTIEIYALCNTLIALGATLSGPIRRAPKVG